MSASERQTMRLYIVRLVYDMRGCPFDDLYQGLRRVFPGLSSAGAAIGLVRELVGEGLLAWHREDWRLGCRGSALSVTAEFLALATEEYAAAMDRLAPEAKPAYEIGLWLDPTEAGTALALLPNDGSNCVA